MIDDNDDCLGCLSGRRAVAVRVVEFALAVVEDCRGPARLAGMRQSMQIAALEQCVNAVAIGLGQRRIPECGSPLRQLFRQGAGFQKTKSAGGVKFDVHMNCRSQVAGKSRDYKPTALCCS